MAPGCRCKATRSYQLSYTPVMSFTNLPLVFESADVKPASGNATALAARPPSVQEARIDPGELVRPAW
jgi:hypothetical protein